MLTATRGAEAWSTAFADGHGVFAVLDSSHQAVSPVGVLGGPESPDTEFLATPLASSTVPTSLMQRKPVLSERE